MSRHDELIRLRHMRDHAAEAIAITKGKKRDDLATDRLLELALVRLMEISAPADQSAGCQAKRAEARCRSCQSGPRLCNQFQPVLPGSGGFEPAGGR